MAITGYDDITGLFAAYGVRKVVSTYSGNLVRIRRSSDSTEQDFGFDGNGDLDTAGIATFIGGGSGFLVTWYDQSGNGYDVTQATTTAQPTYTASGINSLPTFAYDGGDYLESTDAAIATAFSGTNKPATMTVVVRNTATSSFRSYASIGRTSSNTPFIQVGRSNLAVGFGSRRTDGNVDNQAVTGHSHSLNLDLSAMVVFGGGSGNYVSGARNESYTAPVSAAGDTTLDRIRIGANEGGYTAPMIGWMSEVAIYSAAVTIPTESRDIARYQNSYYSLYTEPTYTGDNASDFLDIPTGETPTDTYQAIHPDVLDISFSSYKYWMAMTPYTDSDTTVEEPHILVSSDGDTWAAPSGGSNPIYTSGAIDGDTDLILAQDSKLYCYWFQNGGTDYIMESNSSDGTTWSAAAQMLTVTNEGSPCVIWDGSQYVLYTSNVSSSTAIWRRTSSSPNSGWSSASSVTLGQRGTRRPWDFNIFYESGTYYGLFSYSTSSTGQNTILYYGTSADGTTWTLDSEAVLGPTNFTGWDNGKIYRAGAVKTATGWDLWYSAQSQSNTWHTGRITLPPPSASSARSFSVVIA